MLYKEYPYLLEPEEITEIMRKHKIHFETAKIDLTLCYSPLPPKRGRESDEHRAIKQAMAQKLKDLGEDNPEFEYGDIDVFSRKLGLAVECGDTPIARIIAYFKRQPFCSYIKEAWTVDYAAKDGKYELIKFKRL